MPIITIPYAFEELPLVLLEDGYAAGLIDGIAAITIDSDTGTWEVGAVRVEVDKVEWRDGKRVAYPSKSARISPFLEFMIRKTLCQDPVWRQRVQDVVDEALRPSEREYEPEEISA